MTNIKFNSLKRHVNYIIELIVSKYKYFYYTLDDKGANSKAAPPKYCEHFNTFARHANIHENKRINSQKNFILSLS